MRAGNCSRDRDTAGLRNHPGCARQRLSNAGKGCSSRRAARPIPPPTRDRGAEGREKHPSAQQTTPLPTGARTHRSPPGSRRPSGRRGPSGSQPSGTPASTHRASRARRRLASRRSGRDLPAHAQTSQRIRAHVQALSILRATGGRGSASFPPLSTPSRASGMR